MASKNRNNRQAQGWMVAFCSRFASLISLALLSILLLAVSDQASAEYADVVLNRNSEKEGVRPVIYPHWFHRIRFQCRVCHSELGFEMRVGANNVTMEGIIDGKFCGACHNGEIAWSVLQRHSLP